MSENDDYIRKSIKEHLKDFCSTKALSESIWKKGPVAATMPQLSIIRLPYSSHLLYASCGAYKVTMDSNFRVEFVLLAPEESDQNIELLSLVSYMHRDQRHRLDVGHTMSIGRPWLPNSNLSSLLVSLPYFAGPKFEVLHAGEVHIRFLWLIPITAGEERFCHENGLEALERRFEARQINYLDPYRESVV